MTDSVAFFSQSHFLQSFAAFDLSFNKRHDKSFFFCILFLLQTQNNYFLFPQLFYLSKYKNINNLFGLDIGSSKIRTQQKFKVMSKTRIVDRLSKSLHKKPANDLYFPAIDFKDNINFPFKKTIKFRPSQKNKNVSHIYDIDIQASQNNPQTNFSEQKKPQKAVSTSMFRDTTKMQEMNRKASSTSKQWLNKSAIYFTKRQKQIFENKSIELEQQKSKLGQKFMERKQSFENFKKMKQMLREQQKRALLDDLQFKRQERQREHKIRHKQFNEQKIFLHEQNLSKIQMERCLKFRNKQEQLKLAKQKYSQTEDNSHFLKMEDFKAKQSHMHLLESRLVFLMNDRLKNTEQESYLDERMTSRSFYRQNASQSSRSKDITGRN